MSSGNQVHLELRDERRWGGEPEVVEGGSKEVGIVTFRSVSNMGSVARDTGVKVFVSCTHVFCSPRSAFSGGVDVGLWEIPVAAHDNVGALRKASLWCKHRSTPMCATTFFVPAPTLAGHGVVGGIGGVGGGHPCEKGTSVPPPASTSMTTSGCMPSGVASGGMCRGVAAGSGDGSWAAGSWYAGRPAVLSRGGGGGGTNGFWDAVNCACPSWLGGVVPGVSGVGAEASAV